MRVIRTNVYCDAKDCTESVLDIAHGTTPTGWLSILGQPDIDLCPVHTAEYLAMVQTGEQIAERRADAERRT